MQWPSNLLIHKLEIHIEKCYQKRVEFLQKWKQFSLKCNFSLLCCILEPFCSTCPFRETATEINLMDEIIWRYLRGGLSSIFTEPNRHLNVPFCVGAEGDEVRSPRPHTVLHKPFTPHPPPALSFFPTRPGLVGFLTCTWIAHPGVTRAGVSTRETERPAGSAASFKGW